MKELILIAQIIISIALVFIISIQSKGNGLGSAFGQSSSVSFKRRGLEKIIFKATFALSFLFIVISGIQFLL